MNMFVPKLIQKGYKSFLMKKKFNIFLIIFFFFISSSLYASQIQNIEVKGNERISNATIEMFSDVKIGQNINEIDLNKVLKNLYNSYFFENVSVEIIDDNLVIFVVESPVIENINFEGIKSNKINSEIRDNLTLKSRSSFNNFLLLEDKEKIKTTLKNFGYYFSEVNTYITNLDDNKVNINFEIDLGNKSKIKKISFIGNKIYKNKKLRSLIISEEYKFWKFISGKKFLNEEIINFDERLLKNFYLNKGYYNVKINSSFAKMINEDEFELIFNINPNEKVFFNDLKLDIPDDFSKENFSEITNLFNDFKGKPYSLNKVEKILEKIEIITINDQYLSVKATVEESLISNKLNLIFKVDETEKFYVKKINIFGNNVTEESVIRNQFEVDEGDPYNEILKNKTINNLKGLNFFRTVKSETVTDDKDKSKIINITVEEKPTGEIFAGAGAGTAGATISAGIKENNYLGRGLTVRAEGTLTEESFKGQFSLTNPNYKNTDKSIFFSLQALEIDRLTESGYKTNKTGLDLGTGFEFLDDLYLNLSTSSFYEKIETNSSASDRQKAQEGDYWDTFVKLNIDLDKRNQRFRTTEGYRSSYGIDMPVISETNTLTNSYNFKYFTELYEDNISSLSLFLQTANSLTGDDIKLSERLYVPSSKLRGFEKGKVGPKDGSDFVGGNFVTAFNVATTLPQILPNVEDVDINLFFDAANIWGVDYDSSIDDGSKIRSAVGIGIDWFTAIGPMNFSFTETISKSNSDISESFRFNIGTSF